MRDTRHSTSRRKAKWPLHLWLTSVVVVIRENSSIYFERTRQQLATTETTAIASTKDAPPSTAFDATCRILHPNDFIFGSYDDQAREPSRDEWILPFANTGRSMISALLIRRMINHSLTGCWCMMVILSSSFRPHIFISLSRPRTMPVRHAWWARTSQHSSLTDSKAPNSCGLERTLDFFNWLRLIHKSWTRLKYFLEALEILFA